MNYADNNHQFECLKDYLSYSDWLRKISYGLGVMSTGAVLLVYIGILMAVAPAVVSASDESKVEKDLRAIFDQDLRHRDVVNSLLSYRTEPSKRSFSLQHGLADPDAGVAMTQNHQIHIASMTKTFTAVLVLQLVEEGFFKLDSTLGEIFAGQTVAEMFPDYQFNQSHSDGRPIGSLKVEDFQRYGNKAQGHKITVRQLLQHTHGMPDLTFDAQTGSHTLANQVISDAVGQPLGEVGISRRQWSGEMLLEYYLRSALPKQSLFRPGQGFHYGDTGFVISALLVEKFTGMSLANAYRQRIFDPLSLNDTYLHHYEPRRSSASVGTAHRFIDLRSSGLEGVGIVDVDQQRWNTSIDWAGGGLVSTADDLHRFYRALVNGDLFNDPATLLQMVRYVKGSDEEPWYGLGVGVVLDPNTQDVVALEHGGFWGSYFLYHPQTDRSVVFTVNQVGLDLEPAIEKLRRSLVGQKNTCSSDVSDYRQEIRRLQRQIQRQRTLIRRLKRN